MKKNFISILLIALVLTSFVIPLSAKTDNNIETNYLPSGEIEEALLQDLNEMYQRAINGISDEFPVDNAKIKQTFIFKNLDTGEQITADTINTIKLVDVSIKDGIEQKTYRMVSFIEPKKIEAQVIASKEASYIKIPKISATGDSHWELNLSNVIFGG